MRSVGAAADPERDSVVGAGLRADRERTTAGGEEPARVGETGSSALTCWLEGDEAAVRSRVRELLERPIFRYDYDAPRRELQERVMTWLRELAAAGLGNLALPREAGAGDVSRLFAAYATLGHFDVNLTIKFGVQFILFGRGILLLGTERHHHRFLPKVRSLETPGCYAMTEIGHGSNIRDIETTATYDPTGDELVLDTPTPNARKLFIGNLAVHGRAAIVFAQLVAGGGRHGVVGVVVPLRDADGTLCAGIEIGDAGAKSGLNGIDNGWLRLDQVRVPRENLLDRLGELGPDGVFRPKVKDVSAAVLRTMIEGRIAIAHAALSASKSALTITLRYAGRRRQFGRAGGPERVLLDYPAVQRRLLPRLAKAYVMHAGLQHLTDRYAPHAGNAAMVEALGAVLKVRSTWDALDIVQSCREACGGQAVLAVNRIGVIRADIDALTTLEGDNTVLTLVVARELVRQAQASARPLVTPPAPADRPASPGPQERADLEWLVALFRYREQKAIACAAQVIGDAERAGRERHDAYADAAALLSVVTEANVDRVLVEEFTRHQRSCADPVARRLLEQLGEVFALTRIEELAGWYLEDGVVSRGTVRWVHTRLDTLCHELREHAEQLVDAFAIPDVCLAAPIGQRRPAPPHEASLSPTETWRVE